MKKLITSLFIFLGLLGLNFADTLPQHFPNDLIYQGKPIDPLCFYEMDSNYGVISLAKCGIKSRSGRSKTSTDAALLSKGFVGFNFSCYVNRCHSYYKVIGSWKGEEIILAINGTGGSGSFSTIYSIKRDSNHIQVKLVKSGDRCNNGVKDVTLKNQIINYKVTISPFDFVSIDGENSKKLRAYDDLAACASCCVADAIYEHNLEDTNTSNDKFIAIDLGDPNKKLDANFQGNSQACFNQLFVDYQKQGKRLLDPKLLSEFVKSLNSNCTPTQTTKAVTDTHGKPAAANKPNVESKPAVVNKPTVESKPVVSPPVAVSKPAVTQQTTTAPPSAILHEPKLERQPFGLDQPGVIGASSPAETN
ncbi:MAG: hypothetical protein ABI597_08080 [Gammaproteobacteria bacterium]